MKILLYGINYKPELTGIGKYSGEMAEWLAQNEHEVVVVTAPPYYPQWKVQQGYSATQFTDDYQQGVRVLRCPLYVPKSPNTIKRIMHLLSFSLSSCIALFKLRQWKPDLIVYVVPTLFCALQILLYARFVKSKVALHIQDFEVDALFGLGMVRQGKIATWAYQCERWLLSRFDIVSTISTGMYERALEKGVEQKKLVLFPNWSEVKRFQNAQTDPNLLLQLGIKVGAKVVLYSGNMGEKQGLEVVMETAHQMMTTSPDIQFLMVGDGGGKARLQLQAQQLGLTNVVFSSLLPYEQLPALLASANCHLVVQKRGVADAVLPSKLTNILAVGGNSVITSDANTTLGRLCKDFTGIAVLVEPESSEALRRGIEQALKCSQPNQVAQNYARDFLDKDVILQRYIKDVS